MAKELPPPRALYFFAREKCSVEIALGDSSVMRQGCHVLTQCPKQKHPPPVLVPPFLILREVTFSVKGTGWDYGGRAQYHMRMHRVYHIEFDPLKDW